MAVIRTRVRTFSINIKKKMMYDSREEDYDVDGAVHDEWMSAQKRRLLNVASIIMMEMQNLNLCVPNALREHTNIISLVAPGTVVAGELRCVYGLEVHVCANKSEDPAFRMPVPFYETFSYRRAQSIKRWFMSVLQAELDNRKLTAKPTSTFMTVPVRHFLPNDTEHVPKQHFAIYYEAKRNGSLLHTGGLRDVDNGHEARKYVVDHMCIVHEKPHEVYVYWRDENVSNMVNNFGTEIRFSR